MLLSFFYDVIRHDFLDRRLVNFDNRNALKKIYREMNHVITPIQHRIATPVSAKVSHLLIQSLWGLKEQLNDCLQPPHVSADNSFFIKKPTGYNQG